MHSTNPSLAAAFAPSLRMPPLLECASRLRLWCAGSTAYYAVERLGQKLAVSDPPSNGEHAQHTRTACACDACAA